MWTCILLVVLISSVSGSGPFKKCDTENLTDLNNCLTQTINENLKSLIVNGLPEWKLEPTDPYNYRTTTVDFKIAGFENVVSETELRGISKMDCESISFNPSTMIVQWSGKIPELRVTGQYHLSGQLFALQLVGHGPFWAILSNVTSVMEQKLVVNNGRIQVENNAINLNIGKFRARLNKLFNGDAVIGETVNAFVNENSDEFVEIFKPVITEPVRAVFNKIITRQLNEISVDKLLHMKP